MESLNRKVPDIQQVTVELMMLFSFQSLDPPAVGECHGLLGGEQTTYFLSAGILCHHHRAFY